MNKGKTNIFQKRYLYTKEKRSLIFEAFLSVFNISGTWETEKTIKTEIKKM